MDDIGKQSADISTKAAAHVFLHSHESEAFEERKTIFE